MKSLMSIMAGGCMRERISGCIEHLDPYLYSHSSWLSWLLSDDEEENCCAQK